MARKYYTTTKSGEEVEVDYELAKQLIASGKKTPSDFEIEEYDSVDIKSDIKPKMVDTPEMSSYDEVVSGILPRIYQSDENLGINFGKDVASLPGRALWSAGSALGQLGKDFYTGNWEGLGERALTNIDNEMRQTDNNGFVEGIIKSPLTGMLSLASKVGSPIVAITGKMGAPGRILTTPVGQSISRAATTTGLTLGDIKTDRIVDGSGELTTQDYLLAAGTGIAPELLRGIGAKLTKGTKAASKQADKIKSVVDDVKPGETEKFLRDQAIEETADKLAKSKLSKAATILAQTAGVGIGGVPGAGLFLLPHASKVITRSGPVIEQVLPTVSKATGVGMLERFSNERRQDKKYQDKLNAAMADNKLTETEFKAYKNPGNRENFYKRFPEYK